MVGVGGVQHLYDPNTLGDRPLEVLFMTWMSSVAMVLSLAGCAWHRRRMQRRREGYFDTLDPLLLVLAYRTFSLDAFYIVA